jgi:DNA-binding transcriptional ArsR family regulator
MAHSVTASERIKLPTPDYEADDVLVVRESEQLRALGDDLRAEIVVLLRERAHSTTELAEKLGLPKGTVGHHVKVLEKAGLIRVVRTRQVRALTEKLYGRTARLFLFKSSDDADGEDVRNVAAASLRTAVEEMLPLDDDNRTTFAVLRVRLTDADARRFVRRLDKLTDDFLAADDPEGEPYGLAEAMFRRHRIRRLHRHGRLWANADFLKLWPASPSASSAPGLGLRGSLAAVSLRHRSSSSRRPRPAVHPLCCRRGVGRLRRRPIMISGDAARALLIGYIPVAWPQDPRYLAAAFAAVRDRDLHGHVRRRAPFVPPWSSRRDQLVDGNSKLQITVSASLIGGQGWRRADQGTHRAVPNRARRRDLHRLDSVPAPHPNRGGSAGRAEGSPRPRMWPGKGASRMELPPYLKWIAACTATSN